MAESPVYEDSSSAIHGTGPVVPDDVPTVEDQIEAPPPSVESTSRHNMPQYEEVYPIKPDARGIVIIFNHEKYETGEAERTGTGIDVELLKETFTALNFTVHIHDDLTKSDIDEKLDEVKKNTKLADCDCFIIVVLTHGEAEGNLHAKDKIYHYSDLWKKFTAKECEALNGKPKLLILQACRGTQDDKGKDFQTDSTASSFLYCLPVEEDFLIAYATTENYKAFRTDTEGSRFIGKLCEQLNPKATEDMLSMLTNVCREVAVKEVSGFKQMPVFETTLTRKLFLTRNNNVEGDWNSLRPYFVVPREILPPDSGIYHLSMIVKQFLKDENRTLDRRTVQQARMMLMLISRWPRLHKDMRCIAFRKLGAFIFNHPKCQIIVDRELEDLKKSHGIIPKN